MVVTIVGILATIAVPSFQALLERNRLKQVVEGLKSDLQWMRTETIKQSCNLKASFTTGAAWSYQIFIPPAVPGSTCAIQHVNNGCAAAATANCNIRTVNSAPFPGTTMGTVVFSNPPPTEAEFDFRRGEAKRNGRVELSSPNHIIKVVVDPVGRVKICNIAGSNGLPSYPDC